MRTLVCTLGFDAEDASLNRPVVVLPPAETAEILTLLLERRMPLLELASRSEGEQGQSFGMSQLPGLRQELHGALAGIEARALPDRLILALALQRLATACETALEFGMNLYVVVTGEP